MFTGIFGIAAVLLLMLGSGHVRAFNIPSGSMVPTLLVGDYVWADVTAYRKAPPERGDVIVFRRPGGVDYVKRVIGLPGDRVRLAEDKIILNGTELPRRSLGNYVARHSDATQKAERVRVQLPGGRVFDEVLIQSDGPFANTHEVTVPPDAVFVLGDNLDNSMDSRMISIGMVPFSDIEGRMALIYMSAQPHRILSFVH